MQCLHDVLWYDTRDGALEKEDRIDEMKKIKNSPPILHLLQAQQAPALPYAKVVGRPSIGRSGTGWCWVASIAGASYYFGIW